MKRKRGDIAAAVAFLTLSGLLYYQTYTRFVLQQAVGGGPFANSAFYPRVVAGTMAFLALILLIKNLVPLQVRHESDAEETAVAQQDESAGQRGEDRPTAIRLLSIAALLLLYTIALPFFGYIAMTPLFMAGLFWLVGLKRPVTLVLLSILSSAVIYFFFSAFLNVILPHGRFVPW